MQIGIRITLWAAISLLPGQLLPTAHSSDLSKFLRDVFHDQNGRPPTGAEVNYYSNVSRTDGPLESLARMMASNDYYNVQCQQNPNLYVTRLYEVFLRREPSLEEQRYWASRVPGYSYDARLGFVREFCRANNINDYVPSAPGMLPWPTAPVGSQVESAANLVAKSKQLSSTVQYELGGTVLGQDIVRQANILVAAASQYYDAISSTQSTSQQLVIAANNVISSFQGLQARFRSVPGASVASQNLMWEMSQLLVAMQQTAGQAQSSPYSSNRSAEVATEARQLLALLRQLTTYLSAYQQQNYLYVTLYRDANALAVQTESLELMARSGATSQDLQRVATSLLSQARSLGSQISQADPNLKRGWWNIQHELDQLALAAGCGGDFYVTSSQPVILNHPAWQSFPVSPSPGYQASADSRQIVSMIDQLLNLIDNYSLSLRPLAGQSREVALMLNETLELQHAVLVLRQQFVSGVYGGQVRNASSEAVRLYSAARPAFLQMVGVAPALNSPSWLQIGELTTKIDRAVQ